MKKTSESLAGLLKLPPASIADMLSSETLFSGGPAAGLRMLTVYMAYTGRRLSPSQRQSLKLARELLIARTQHVAKAA